MEERYEEAVRTFRLQQERRQGLLQLSLDLQTLSQVKFPSELLEKIVFEKCVVSSKGLASVISLSGSTDDLRNSIDLRNDLVTDFKEHVGTMTELQRIQLYVGAPQEGQVDSCFPHNMDALVHHTDDCIFFGMLVADELLQRSKKLWARNWWKYRLGEPKLSAAKWDKARAADLLPDPADYVLWTEGFQKPPSRWQRLRSWLAGKPSEQDAPSLEKTSVAERI
jgi:hypothetical protein